MAWSPLIDPLLSGSAELRRVHRRPAGVYDPNNSNRFTPGAELVALVRLRVQPRGTDLDRQEDGDATTGGVDVWAPLEDLALAEDVTAPGVPLGWTELQIAPAKHTEGPPGDRVEWNGRLYEITSEEFHDGDGPLIGGFDRYVGTEKGAA